MHLLKKLYTKRTKRKIVSIYRYEINKKNKEKINKYLNEYELANSNLERHKNHFREKDLSTFV